MCSACFLYIINSIILEVKSLFSIDIFGFNISINKFDNLIEYLYEIYKSDPEGVSVSNKGGWQSNSLINNSKFSPLLLDVTNQISSHFRKKYNITELWGNISSKYCYNSIHTHSYVGHGAEPYKSLSGVIYLQTPEDCGGLRIHNPIFIDQNYYYEPKVGSVIVFPTTLPHAVETNLSDKDRISLAFNAYI